MNTTYPIVAYRSVFEREEPQYYRNLAIKKMSVSEIAAKIIEINNQPIQPYHVDMEIAAIEYKLNNSGHWWSPKDKSNAFANIDALEQIKRTLKMLGYTEDK